MEKKNMVLLTVIAVATLLVAVVGATFAYFTATSSGDFSNSGGQGNTSITTATVAKTTTTASIEKNAGSFTKTDIYPGHMEVAGLSVKVASESEVQEDTNFTVPFVYNVTKNELGSDVKYYLYRGTKGDFADLTVDMGCNINVESQKGQDSNETWYSEKCSFKKSNEHEEDPKVKDTSTYNDKTLTLVATGNLKGGEETVSMVDEISVTSNSKETEVYYYFVVEYVNKQDAGENDGTGSQNEQMGKSLTGKLSVA